MTKEFLRMKLADLVPYENNPRNNEEAVDATIASMQQCGNIDPIEVDENNVILSGHTRRLALMKMGYEESDVVRVSGLTDLQKKKYRILANKTNEFAGWDFGKLEEELDGLDFEGFDFGFDLDLDGILEDEKEIEEDEIPLKAETRCKLGDLWQLGEHRINKAGGYYGDERERTNRKYNLDILDPDNLTNDFWQMPIIENNGYIPNDLIGFNYAKTSKNKNAGIHFYIDDYQFERIWNYPEKYIDVLKEYSCILTPDFSLYMDMPMAMKIWNVYRSRQIGAYYQSMGFNVIPTISWAEPATFEFCFKGIPKGSIVSISTIGVKRDKDALKIWCDGVTEMIKQIEPSAILIYGGALEYDYGNIKVVYFENKVTENLR